MIRYWSLFLFISLLTNCFANDFKIVGGNTAKPGEFPYMVSVQRSDDNGQTYYHCSGGSIYNEVTILTHSKCIYEQNEHQQVRIVAGEHNLYMNDSTEQIRIKFKSQGVYNNELGVLGLFEPLIFNEYVQPIVLPEPDSIPDDGTNCTVSGWGITSINDTAIYNVPRKFVAPIVSYDTCANSSGITGGAELCTANAGGTGLCQYDMGNPLVLNDNQGPTNLQIGIAAYGGCGIQGNYDVYIRLSEYTTVIRENYPYSPVSTVAPPTTSAGTKFHSIAWLLEMLIVIGISIYLFY